MNVSSKFHAELSIDDLKVAITDYIGSNTSYDSLEPDDLTLVFNTKEGVLMGIVTGVTISGESMDEEV